MKLYSELRSSQNELKLYKHIPLKFPLSVYIQVCNICNNNCQQNKINVVLQSQVEK